MTYIYISNNNKNKQMIDWTKIEDIAKKTRDELLKNGSLCVAEDINLGWCAIFAKTMFDTLLEQGIESEIVVTEKFELQDELEGYETTDAEYDEGVHSHAYIKIEDFCFDAVDADGVNEEYMQYLLMPEYI